MGDLLLYLLIAVFGYILAARVIRKGLDREITGWLQTLAILILVFCMGARMGANEEVIRSLNKIGLYAFVLTVAVLIFSVLSVSVFRRLMGLDRKGRPRGEKAEPFETAEFVTGAFMEPSADKSTEEKDGGEKNVSGGTMTFLIVLTVGFGMFFGYALIHYDLAQYEAFDALTGGVIKAGLCFLIFLVGLDLGDEGTFAADIRAAGAKVLVIPAAEALGTLLGAALCVFVLPFSLGEVLAVGAGFGWYSFAPVMLMEQGLVMVSAVSFMHNVMRELFAMLLIPLIARKLGYLEAVALPGSSASDVCLPVIVKSTRGGIAIYSFVTGIAVSFLVPVLVPLFAG